MLFVLMLLVILNVGGLSFVRLLCVVYFWVLNLMLELEAWCC